MILGIGIILFLASSVHSALVSIHVPSNGKSKLRFSHDLTYQRRPIIIRKVDRNSPSQETIWTYWPDHSDDNKHNGNTEWTTDSIPNFNSTSSATGQKKTDGAQQSDLTQNHSSEDLSTRGVEESQSDQEGTTLILDWGGLVGQDKEHESKKLENTLANRGSMKSRKKRNIDPEDEVLGENKIIGQPLDYLYRVNNVLRLVSELKRTNNSSVALKEKLIPEREALRLQTQFFNMLRTSLPLGNSTDDQELSSFLHTLTDDQNQTISEPPQNNNGTNSTASDVKVDPELNAQMEVFYAYIIGELLDDDYNEDPLSGSQTLQGRIPLHWQSDNNFPYPDEVDLPTIKRPPNYQSVPYRPEHMKSMGKLQKKFNFQSEEFGRYQQREKEKEEHEEPQSFAPHPNELPKEIVDLLRKFQLDELGRHQQRKQEEEQIHYAPQLNEIHYAPQLNELPKEYIDPAAQGHRGNYRPRKDRPSGKDRHSLIRRLVSRLPRRMMRNLEHQRIRNNEHQIPDARRNTFRTPVFDSRPVNDPVYPVNNPVDGGMGGASRTGFGSVNGRNVNGFYQDVHFGPPQRHPSVRSENPGDSDSNNKFGPYGQFSDAFELFSVSGEEGRTDESEDGSQKDDNKSETDYDALLRNSYLVGFANGKENQDQDDIIVYKSEIVEF